MIKRIGNKFYTKGIPSYLVSVWYEVDISTFKINKFNIRFNSTYLPSDLGPTVVAATNQAMGYIEELLKDDTKTSRYYEMIWTQEKNDLNNLDWLMKNVWGNK